MSFISLQVSWLHKGCYIFRVKRVHWFSLDAREFMATLNFWALNVGHDSMFSTHTQLEPSLVNQMAPNH